MPNIYLYADAKAIVPWANGVNDVVIYDPEVRIPPHQIVGNDGRFRKHTPKEMGIPGVRLISGKPIRRSQGDLLEEWEVGVASMSHQQIVGQREQEDMERRKSRQVELAQWRINKLMAGRPQSVVDHELEIKTAIIENNRMKKDQRLLVQDALALQRKIKMAKVRSKRRK